MVQCIKKPYLLNDTILATLVKGKKLRIVRLLNEQRRTEKKD